MMREYKLFIMLILLIILFPIKTNALVCSNQDMVKLKSMAQNITTNYDYKEENNNVTFNITFSNLSPDLYLVDVTNKKNYYYNNTEMTYNGYKSGESYKFKVYSTNSLCDTSVLYTVYVTLPYFNSYYNNELCKGIEEYELCQKWSSVNISYNEFKNKVDKYKEVIEEENNENNTDNEVKGIFDYIRDFYISYYYIILPLIILISIIYIYNKNKKNDLF